MVRPSRVALPTAWDLSLRELSAAPRATLLLEEDPIGRATLWLELRELAAVELRELEVLLLWETLPELLWEVPLPTWELRELEVLLLWETLPELLWEVPLPTWELRELEPLLLWEMLPELLWELEELLTLGEDEELLAEDLFWEEEAPPDLPEELLA